MVPDRAPLIFRLVPLLVSVSLLFVGGNGEDDGSWPGFRIQLVQTQMDFRSCQQLAARWKNSSLVEIRNLQQNSELRTLLQGAQMQRAWLGAALEVPRTIPPIYLWTDAVGSVVGGVLSRTSDSMSGSSSSISSSQMVENSAPQTGFVNWASNRPSDLIEDGAITLDSATGKWLDMEKSSAFIYCVLAVPLDQEVTKTVELPPYEFEEEAPLVTETSSDAISKTVIFSLLLIGVLAAIGLLVLWHDKNPVGKGAEIKAPLSVGKGEENVSPSDVNPKNKQRGASYVVEAPPLPLSEMLKFVDAEEAEMHGRKAQEAAKRGEYVIPFSSREDDEEPNVDAMKSSVGDETAKTEGGEASGVVAVASDPAASPSPSEAPNINIIEPSSSPAHNNAIPQGEDKDSNRLAAPTPSWL